MNTFTPTALENGVSLPPRGDRPGERARTSRKRFTERSTASPQPPIPSRPLGRGLGDRDPRAFQFAGEVEGGAPSLGRFKGCPRRELFCAYAPPGFGQGAFLALEVTRKFPQSPRRQAKA